MHYVKEIKSQRIEDALNLHASQITRIKNAIQEAYNQNWHDDGPNIDQINAFIAPHLLTPEEAFYAATVMTTDVFGMIMQHKAKS